MARVTVEDCVLVVPNRFELCLIASSRAKNILSGSHTDLEQRNEKPAVIALREIGENLVDVDVIRGNIVSSIRNRGNIEERSKDSTEGSTSALIIEEINNNQQAKEATFVSENIEVED